MAAWKQIAAPKKEASDGAGGARPRADKISKKRKLKKLLADDKEFVAQNAASWDSAFSIVNLEAGSTS